MNGSEQRQLDTATEDSHGIRGDDQGREKMCSRREEPRLSRCPRSGASCGADYEWVSNEEKDLGKYSYLHTC